MSHKLLPPPIPSTSPRRQLPTQRSNRLLHFLDPILQRLDHFSLPSITALIRPVNQPSDTTTQDAEEAPKGHKPLKIHIGVLRLVSGQMK
jgi:hypothetical protein